MENVTPVKEACSSGEDLIRGREDAPGCTDVKKQISLLREREGSVLQRARARRDRLLDAADSPVSQLRSEVREIGSWIQESWNEILVILRGEGTPVGNRRKIEVNLYRLTFLRIDNAWRISFLSVVVIFFMSFQQIDIENERMKTKLKETRDNGENLIKYMNSRNENPQPVVAMMKKLNNAWDEFQGKLASAKDAVNNQTLPQVRLCYLFASLIRRFQQLVSRGM